MEITKKWTVTNLMRDKRDGYVYAVGFKLIASEGKEVIGENSGEVGFMDKPDKLPSEFIEYEKLDEATTLTWVKNNLGPDLVKQAEHAVETFKHLDNGIPWE